MTDTATQAGKIQPRLKTKYRNEIAKTLTEEHGYTNVHQVPGLVKIVVNMGVGEAARDGKVIDGSTYAGTRSVRVSRKTGKEI